MEFSIITICDKNFKEVMRIVDLIASGIAEQILSVNFVCRIITIKKQSEH